MDADLEAKVQTCTKCQSSRPQNDCIDLSEGEMWYIWPLTDSPHSRQYYNLLIPLDRASICLLWTIDRPRVSRLQLRRQYVYMLPNYPLNLQYACSTYTYHVRGHQQCECWDPTGNENGDECSHTLKWFHIKFSADCLRHPISRRWV